MKNKILLILCSIFMIGILSGCSKVMKLNETATVDTDKIKITVLGSEKVKIDDDMSIANGEYVKVKMTIENYGNSTYSWSSLNFSLGDEMVSLNTLGQSDILKSDIEAGETATGYIYFDTTDANKLTYTSNSDVTGDKAKVETVEFKIK